jgi:hypothetical protein
MARSVRFALGALVFLLVSAVPVASNATSAFVATNQHTAIPAYWAPDTEAGAEMFRRLAQNYPANDIVVINGRQSGPQAPFHAAWADAITAVHEAGALAIGYVDTGYYGVAFPPATSQATRPDGPGAGGTSIAAWTAQITHDVDQWHNLYGTAGVDGIFLDQTIALCGTATEPDHYVDLYAAISDYISARYPDDHIIINPGMPVDQCYDDIADTIVTFENTYAVYTDANNPLNQTPAWQLNHPDPSKFWHLVYDVPTEAAMRLAVAESKIRNAGYVYVTDDRLVVDGTRVVDFPWDTIPSYWDAELAAADGRVDTTPPARPTTVAGTARSGTATAKATLSWEISSDNVAVVGYEVAIAGGPTATTTSNGITVRGLTPSTAYTFTVRARDASGNLSRRSAQYTLTTPPPASAPIVDAVASRTATTITYAATFVDPFPHHRVFINSDNDPATGFALPPGRPAGIDHMIENSRLYRYTGTGGGWGWTPVDGVAPLVSTTDDRYVWQVPISAFNTVATAQVLVFQAAPPDAYSETLVVTA